MRRLVLGIAVAVTSLLPVLGMADDQQIADYIKSRLQAEQSQGNLKGFNVDMRVERGTVWFKGHVSNSTQEMTILKAAQQAGHLGVVQVVDDIEIKGITETAVPAQTVQAAPTQPVQTAPMTSIQQTPTMAVQVAPATNMETVPATPYQNAGFQQQSNVQYQQMPMAQASSQRLVSAPMMNNAAGGIAMGGQPLPFAQADGTPVPPAPIPTAYAGAGGMQESPNLPGYAWPGYAANPNYAAVTYPKQYSASAWPYIGPFYPYPQVPLGWRKVSLEWDDGFWMLDFHDK